MAAQEMQEGTVFSTESNAVAVAGWPQRHLVEADLVVMRWGTSDGPLWTWMDFTTEGMGGVLAIGPVGALGLIFRRFWGWCVWAQECVTCDVR